MDNEELARQIGHLQGTVEGLAKQMTSQHDDIKEEFKKGSARMNGHDTRIDKLEHAETRRRSILRVLAFIVAAVGLERLAEWLSHLSK